VAGPDPVFFTTALEFRAWLSVNAATANELAVGFRKVGTGLPSLTWPESVDVALCFGWIDGVRKRIDDASYQIRFSPRRTGSIWSAVNIAKAEQLIAEGRMEPPGQAAFDLRTERKSAIYSYEQEGGPALAPSELEEFRKNGPAWAYFQALPPGYRRTMTHWIVSTKQPAARARRLMKFMDSCAAGIRLLP
jgi:uncharacterized protein YdeI (YjbR/CyaY-like superfamily)